MSLRVIACVVLLLTLVAADGFSSCTPRSIPDFRADDTDCSKFHICSFGVLVSLSCVPGSVYHEASHSCVPAYSSQDTCSHRMALRQRCSSGTLEHVAHPTSCTHYYNCSEVHANRRGEGAREPGLNECRYPFVFSQAENKCVLMKPGLCGGKEEPLDACDYEYNQCQSHAHCAPCEVRFPTCRGRQDGLNDWRGRQGSPYYVVCEEQRVISTGTCTQRGGLTLFDQERRECVVQNLRVPNFIHTAQANPDNNLPQTNPEVNRGQAEDSQNGAGFIPRF